MQEHNNGQNNFVRYMANPKAFTLKKWFYDMLKTNYVAHDTIVERVAASLTTDKDLEDFGKLIGEVFEKGYRKAIDDYRAEIERLGLNVTVVSPQ